MAKVPTNVEELRTTKNGKYVPPREDASHKDLEVNTLSDLLDELLSD